MRIVRRRSLWLITGWLVVAAILALLQGGTASGQSQSNAIAAAKPAHDTKIVGYYAEWDLYGRAYYLKNEVSNGTGSKINVLNYAFGSVTANNVCDLADSWADYQKPFDASMSVTGQDDSSATGALHGNFNQLVELKQMYPNIKVMISLGGFGGSANFSTASQPANVQAFVASCVSTFITDSRWAGLFDGIDIDWEYPAACGAQCGVPADTKNFTAMLAEFRKQLNAVRPGLLLTIATSAGPAKYSKIQLSKVQHYVDWINLMTYDLHGTWETTTNHAAPLQYSQQDPTKSGFSMSRAVTGYLKSGVPANKIVVGIPFYGHGWTGVPDVNHGLYQKGTGPATGTWEAGSEDYKVLKTYEATYTKYFDPIAKASWIYDPASGNFWSYDDPSTVALKGKYIMSHKLRGAMYWEMSSDDASGSLITALYNSTR